MNNQMTSYIRLLAVGAGTVGGAAAGAALYDEHPAIGAGVGNAAVSTTGLTVDGVVQNALAEDNGTQTNGVSWRLVLGAAPIVLSTIGAVAGAAMWKKHPSVGAAIGSTTGLAAGVGVDWLWFLASGGIKGAW